MAYDFNKKPSIESLTN